MVREEKPSCSNFLLPLPTRRLCSSISAERRRVVFCSSNEIKIGEVKGKVGGSCRWGEPRCLCRAQPCTSGICASPPPLFHLQPGLGALRLFQLFLPPSPSPPHTHRHSLWFWANSSHQAGHAAHPELPMHCLKKTVTDPVR